MDGMKRKASASPPKDHTNTYMGSTPLQTMPASLQQESALRYTLSPTSYPRNPAGLAPGAAPSPARHETYATRNNATEQQALPATAERSEEQRRDSISAAEDMVTDHGSQEEDDDVSVHVDTDDGHDQIYMLNEGRGSWFGTLPSEDHPNAHTKIDEQAVLAIQHLKRAQELAAEQQRVKAANMAAGALRQGQERPSEQHVRIGANIWSNDLMLRTTIRRIKRALAKAAILKINKLTSQFSTLCCSYPFCLQIDNVIPPGAYYLTLHEHGDSSSHYCLTCLEDLWNGKALMGPAPAPQVRADDTQPQQHLVFSLDGFPNNDWMPQSLLTSKHAPAHLKVPDSQLLPPVRRTPSPITPHIVEDSAPPSPAEGSPRSTTSEGEWLQTPTRFQHLASFISPGDTLSHVEKAAVETWKAASEEQIHWVAFREKYARTVEELTSKDGEGDGENDVLADHTPMCESGPTDHSGIDDGIANGGNAAQMSHQQNNDPHIEIDVPEGETESQPKSDAKLKEKKDCRGQNLSTVLARLSDK